MKGTGNEAERGNEKTRVTCTEKGTSRAYLTSRKVAAHSSSAGGIWVDLAGCGVAAGIVAELEKKNDFRL